MSNQQPTPGQPTGQPGGPQFPSYFDPNREANAEARDRAERGEQYAPYEAPAERDGMIEVDEWGNPVDPRDPDLADAYGALGLDAPDGVQDGVQDPRHGVDGADAGGTGPQLSGFPFPGVSGTTRGGTRYSVSGCCLPIPFGCVGLLGLVGLAASASAGLLRRR